MNIVTKIFEKIEKMFLIISVFTLFIMMLWIFLDVMLRYFFHSPIPGTMELTGEYFMVLIIFLSLSYTYKENGHVRVDMLERRFPETIKLISNICTNLVVIALFALIFVANFDAGLEYFAKDVRSIGALEYPLAPALIITSIGILTITIRLILTTIQMTLTIIKKVKLKKRSFNEV